MNENIPIATINVFRTILSSIYQSIDNNDKEIFYSINSFLYSRLDACYENNNLKDFEDYSNSFVYYYEYAIKKIRLSLVSREIYEVCADRSAKSLKGKLSYGFRFKTEEISVQEKRKINDFSKILLRKFSDIIFISIKYRDFKQLSFILNQLHLVSNSYNQNFFKTKFEIRSLETKELNSEENETLKNLKEKYEQDTFIDSYVSRIYKVTLFWTYFLYHTNIINFDELIELNKIFENYQGYIKEDFLDDLFFLRNNSYNRDYSWENWDIIDHPEGISYSLTNVDHWVTFGAVIYLIKYRTTLDFNIHDKSRDKINYFDYLLSSIAEIIRSLTENGYEKWKSFFNTEIKSEFNEKVDILRRQVEYYKQNNITEKERKIAELPLSDAKIEDFKKRMIAAWKKNNIVRELFNKFGNIEYVTETSPDFLVIGDENKIWQGLKSSLIDDEKFYVSSGGIEQIGYRLSDSEEVFFIYKIIENESIETQTILQEIDKSINKLLEKNFSPSIILIGNYAWDSAFRDLKSEFFVLDWNDKTSDRFSYGGIYRNIPITRLHNEIIKNQIIVTDFNKSFCLYQNVNNLIDKNVININIESISEEYAKKIIESNVGFWRGNLTMELAIVKLRNSVKYDFNTILKFSVQNEDAYSIITMVP